MFIKFKLIVISLCLSLFIGCKTKQEKIVPTEKWVSLFNGKDLNDWIVKIKGHPTGENYKNTFIVEDGLLKVIIPSDIFFTTRNFQITNCVCNIVLQENN